MDSKKRVDLIRHGNDLFNKGDIINAQKIFIEVNYLDGLLRVADYYYDKRQPLFALPFYKKAGANSKVEEIELRMLGALKAMIEKDKTPKESDTPNEETENVITQIEISEN